MWLYFNETGALVNGVLEHGYPARTGSNVFEIFATFNNIEELIENGYKQATLKLIKPDMSESSYDLIAMDNVSRLFTTLPGETTDTPFVNGRYYQGFYVDFSDYEEGQDDPIILLDTPGLWHAIITLYNANSGISVQGNATFNVQDTGYSEDPTELPENWTMEQLLALLAKKLNITSGLYMKARSDENPDDVVLDPDLYNVNDIIYNKLNNCIYIVNNVESELKMILLVDLSINAKIEFATNQDILDLFED